MVVLLEEGVANHKFNANSFKIKCGPPVKRYALWETVAFLFFYLRKTALRPGWFVQNDASLLIYRETYGSQ